jgi:hypothetical protein
MLPRKLAVRVVLDRTCPQPLGSLRESGDLITRDEAVQVIANRHVDPAIPKPGERGVDFAVVEVGNDLLQARIRDAQRPFAFAALDPLANLGRVTAGILQLNEARLRPGRPPSVTTKSIWPPILFLGIAAPLSLILSVRA